MEMEVENDINLLNKGNYILCDIIFKGLKINPLIFNSLINDDLVCFLNYRNFF